MPVSVIISLCVGLGFVIAFMDKCAKHRSVGGVFLKNAASIFFILTAALGVILKANYVYGGLIVLGLVFGMLGDIYLDQKWVYPKDEKQYLYAGFISFGIGHIFYIAGILVSVMKNSLANWKWCILAILIGIIVAIGNLVLEKPTKQNYGEYKIIVTIYGFILATMAGVALIAAIMTGKPMYIVFTIGAVFFLLSDLILSPMYFGEGKNTPGNFVLNHTTYYIGQYLIALTVTIGMLGK